MQQINVYELKPHPRNNEFFDDMSGEAWEAFKESIRTSGVIEPIVITPEKIIISGHQRVRACKELNISTILTDMRAYDNEDQILKDLIETNIRQRGIGNPNPVKLGRCIKELERIYGVKVGKPNYENNSQFKTQADLADELDMDVRTLQNYKLLAEMIPEMEELLDTGIVTKTTILAMIRELSEEEQKELISSLEKEKKYTRAEMDEEIKKYKSRISELIQQGTKTEIITKEVDKPETLAEIQSLKTKLNNKTRENEQMSSMLIEKERMINQAIGISTNYQLTSHCSEITLKMLNFVTEMSKFDYMAESFNEIPIATRIEYKKCIKSVKKWADRILETISREDDIIDM